MKWVAAIFSDMTENMMAFVLLNIKRQSINIYPQNIKTKITAYSEKSVHSAIFKYLFVWNPLSLVLALL